MTQTQTITKTSTQTNAASTPSPRWTHLFAVLAAIALGATFTATLDSHNSKRETTGRRGVRGRRPRRGRSATCTLAGRARSTPTIDKLARKA